MHSHLWDAQRLLLSWLRVASLRGCQQIALAVQLAMYANTSRRHTFIYFSRSLFVDNLTGLQLQHLIPLFSLNLQAEQRCSGKSLPHLCCGQLSIVGPKARRRPAPLVRAHATQGKLNWMTCKPDRSSQNKSLVIFKPLRGGKNPPGQA